MIKHRLLAALTAVFSAGWLIPLWWGVYCYLTFWEAEGWPLLAGQRPMNSFPFIDASIEAFSVAFGWLGAVILFWSYKAFMTHAPRDVA